MSGINVQTALLTFSLGCLKFQAQIKEVVKYDVYFAFRDSRLLQFFQKIFYTSFNKLTRRTSQEKKAQIAWFCFKKVILF